MIDTRAGWKNWLLACLALGGLISAGCKSDVLLGDQAADGSQSGLHASGGAGGSGGGAGTASGAPPAGSGSGASSSSGSGGDQGTSLVWDDTGFVTPDSNDVGISGPWYPYDDCKNAQSTGAPCTMWDPSIGVAPNLGFATSTDEVCAKGTIEKAFNFTLQWGAGIGFNFNGPTTAGGRKPYDAPAHGVTGVRFVITGSVTGATSNVQIGLTTVENELAGQDFLQAVPSPEGTVVDVRWDDPNLQQASYATQMITFDPTELLALEVQINASGSATSEFSFCISHFEALTD